MWCLHLHIKVLEETKDTLTLIISVHSHSTINDIYCVNNVTKIRLYHSVPMLAISNTGCCCCLEMFTSGSCLQPPFFIIFIIFIRSFRLSIIKAVFITVCSLSSQRSPFVRIDYKNTGNISSLLIIHV